MHGRLSKRGRIALMLFCVLVLMTGILFNALAARVKVEGGNIEWLPVDEWGFTVRPNKVLAKPGGGGPCFEATVNYTRRYGFFGITRSKP